MTQSRIVDHKYKMINKIDEKKGKKRLLNMINSTRNCIDCSREY